jgi:hypothetical protein
MKSNPELPRELLGTGAGTGTGTKAKNWCIDCGNTHDPERRRAILARLDNATPAEVYDRLDGLAVHLWGKHDSDRGGHSTLRRDLAAVRRAKGWPDHLSPWLRKHCFQKHGTAA